jgi:type II restriction enzyme
MQTKFDVKLAQNYTSQSQRVRVLTESWVHCQVYCPNCGQVDIDQYSNNKPVADFFCTNCKEDYELKSKNGSVGAKIVDGAYRTMIERLQADNNPNFFFLNYDLHAQTVLDFLVIPKHFFIPDIIEKRKPLSAMAQRAGWVGCNILLKSIPETGKIFFIKNEKVEPKEKVLADWKKTLFLRDEKEISAKGWLLDIMRSVEKLDKREFNLDDVYAFEGVLSKLHPDNKHIKDKIRQQMQVLRDKNYLQFLGRGLYRLN